MDVFELRNAVIADYSAYVRSFLTIRDERIKALVEQELTGGFLWPDEWLEWLSRSRKVKELLGWEGCGRHVSARTGKERVSRERVGRRSMDG